MPRPLPAALAVLLLSTLLPGAAWGAEAVYRFRTQEEGGPAGDPDFCAAAPFTSNLRLDAGVYVPSKPTRDGRVRREGEVRVGTATACARLTDLTFPPGGTVDFYVRFVLPAGAFTARGACTLVSNDVPSKGLVLAGCALKVVSAPPGVAGGVVASTSVFNPGKLPGYATGSQWTLHVYESDRPGALSTAKAQE
ncbi:hypothetical protein P2318_33805 [Myxococcaceae bacterium GXIMD 01537]